MTLFCVVSFFFWLILHVCSWLLCSLVSSAVEKVQLLSVSSLTQTEERLRNLDTVSVEFLLAGFYWILLQISCSVFPQKYSQTLRRRGLPDELKRWFQRRRKRLAGGCYSKNPAAPKAVLINGLHWLFFFFSHLYNVSLYHYLCYLYAHSGKNTFRLDVKYFSNVPWKLCAVINAG